MRGLFWEIKKKTHEKLLDSAVGISHCIVCDVVMYRIKDVPTEG